MSIIHALLPSGLIIVTGWLESNSKFCIDARISGNLTVTQRRYPVSLCFNLGRYRSFIVLELCRLGKANFRTVQHSRNKDGQSPPDFVKAQAAPLAGKQRAK